MTNDAPVPAVTRCGSFHEGHDVHWIQGLRGKEDPETGPGSASVDTVGWVTVSLDNGREKRWWNHDPVRLAGLLEASGSRVVSRTHSVLGIPHDDGSYLISIAGQPSPCPVADEALREASLEEQLIRRGGFTISGAELVRRGLVEGDG